jgi:hypothetical protein
MANYSRWISLGALALLALACTLPWAYYPDLGKHFTGFFSEQNRYGKPAYLLLTLGALSTLMAFLMPTWAKFTGLLAAGLNLAYAIKTIFSFGMCYLAICPEKKLGIWLMLLSASLLLLAAMFPRGRFNSAAAPASNTSAEPPVAPTE